MIKNWCLDNMDLCPLGKITEILCRTSLFKKPRFNQPIWLVITSCIFFFFYMCFICALCVKYLWLNYSLTSTWSSCEKFYKCPLLSLSSVILIEIYCRLPARWGLQQTTLAPGIDETRARDPNDRLLKI